MAFPNLINLIGNIKKKAGIENPEWSGEWGEIAAKQGVNVRRTPLYDLLPESLTGNRPFTFGNTIFVPEGAKTRHGTDADIVYEELPHVQQFRNEGLLGFLGKHIWDLAKHGGGGKTYRAKDTHESYHNDPKEMQGLLNQMFFND